MHFDGDSIPTPLARCLSLQHKIHKCEIQIEPPKQSEANKNNEDDDDKTEDKTRDVKAI